MQLFRSRSLPPAPASCTLDELEPRVLLSTLFGSELPSLADLENASNPIVRFETNVESADGFSHIDIELFVSADGDPTGTVENFLGYVRDGQYDNIIIQRSQSLDGNPDSPSEIIQGGRNRIDDDGNVTAINVGDNITDEVSRENDERTIAMAKTGAPNSANSQWFFNLVDNEDVLGPDSQTNGGFPVFGRVVNDRSWDVVQAIAGLERLDLSTQLSDPDFGGGPYRSTPVTESFDDSDGFTTDEFVTIINAEVIKPEGDVGFFDQAVFYPEGFSNFRTEETLTIVNPNTSEAGDYQVVARFAQGLDRDIVVTQGTLEAGERLEIELQGTGDDGRLIGFNPYAVEVHSAFESSSALPVTATLTRADFSDGSEGFDPFAGESLFNPLAIAEAERQDTLTTWTFADLERDDDALETFITWQNLTGEAGEVTIEFFFEDQASTQLVTPRELDAYRRGGINLEGIGESVLPQKPFAARVTSTVPIVASSSIFRLDQDDPAGTGAALSLGTPGEPGSVAALADARRPQDGSGQIAVVNLGTEDTVVTLEFITSDGTRRESLFNTIEAGRRRLFDLDQLPGSSIAEDTPISVRITSQLAGSSIAAQYTAASTIGGGGALVAPFAATTQIFTDASFIDDDGFSEIVSVYNPSDTSAQVTFAVLFDDGESLGFRTTAPAERRAELDLRQTGISEINAIRNKISEDTDRFSTFSVIVRTELPTANPVTASLTRVDEDAGRRFTVTPTILNGLTPLS